MLNQEKVRKHTLQKAYERINRKIPQLAKGHGWPVMEIHHLERLTDAEFVLLLTKEGIQFQNDDGPSNYIIERLSRLRLLPDQDLEDIPLYVDDTTDEYLESTMEGMGIDHHENDLPFEISK